MVKEEEAVILALIGIVGTVIASLFKLLNANTKAQSSVSKSLDDVAKATERTALATERTADESKKRNGHISKLIVDSKKQILASVQHVNSQHVDKQEVDNQVIKKGK
jgi:hypothetical protein